MVPTSSSVSRCLWLPTGAGPWVRPLWEESPGGGLLRPRCFVLSKKRWHGRCQALASRASKSGESHARGFLTLAPPPSSCVPTGKSTPLSLICKGTAPSITPTRQGHGASSGSVSHLTKGSQGPRGQTPACPLLLTFSSRLLGTTFDGCHSQPRRLSAGRSNGHPSRCGNELFGP